MRHLIFVTFTLAILFGVAPSAWAQEERVEFRGAFEIFYLNRACKDQGWVRGDTAFSRYHPANVGGNGPDTRLTFFFQSFAEGYFLGNSNLTNQFQPVFGAGVGRGPFTFDAEIRATTHSPQHVTPKTSFIKIVGQIRNFDGIEGCEITYKATYIRRNL